MLGKRVLSIYTYLSKTVLGPYSMKLGMVYFAETGPYVLGVLGSYHRDGGTVVTK